MLFTELDLHEEVLSGIETAGFEECTEVQERAIPPAMQGRDLKVQSQTGSGKTAAFLLPVFHRYVTGQIVPEHKTLVIAPTRELADQIYQEAKLLGSSTRLRFAVCYGGVGYHKQEKELNDDPQVIIGTPGRLMDHAKSGRIKFEQFGVLIIDEADRMFDMGFYPDVRWMVSRMPGTDVRQTMLFSATLSVKVMNLAWEYMREPVEITVAAEQITVETIKQAVYHVSKKEKIPFLFGLLEREKPKSCIIFTNTKRGAEEVSRRLSRKGYTSEFIMGDLPQSKRSAIIKRVKRGDLPVLVATDVAARGLHVDDLEMVINFDVPEDPENYVHRIGRTARAGKSGRAFMLACERFVLGLPAIEDYIKQKIPVEPVSEDMLIADSGHSGQERDSRRGGARSSDSRGGGRARRDHGERRGGTGRNARDSRPPEVSRSENGARAGEQSAAKPAAGASRKPAAVGTDKQGRVKDTARAQKPAGSKPDSRGDRGRKRREPPKAAAAPTAASSEAERLAYYRSKYGEDFVLKEKVSGDEIASVGKKRSSRKGVRTLLDRLLGR
ncbi:DEAD/DEAH box helicase [Spirochaeta africana]|uniref:DNA/RNA helicase, superfamily II n=1 Tax=Spirochaeta africana (strain ATCC 700263 / DSM 8902 / Z-7692) TaxID=889378 RepID=H9UJT5_SPIAZ|nr:DEAD/DEAH box helicase [Spirochaeta africana]AFG37778.1 DNA/RNA helicase, superfamily II [Spirochaeta africana DSM 8902]